MNYVENTAEELDSCEMINRSLELDKLARKLSVSCLQSISRVYIPMESKSKARMVDLLSGIAGAYKLVKLAGISPIYLLQEASDWETCTGYYFVVGMHEEIKHRLLKLLEDKANRRDNSYCW